MEQKGLDFNFFIGMFLIFGLLMWFNFNQVPIESTSTTNPSQIPPSKTISKQEIQNNSNSVFEEKTNPSE